MNDVLLQTHPLKRPYLESLTTHELVYLADSFGIDIPPELERIFIIEELLEIVPETADEGDFSAADTDYPFIYTASGELLNETILAEKDIPEPVPLPRQYNITFIEVMPRDPLWAFTFWEIKSHDRELHENAANFAGYHLKVSPRGKASIGKASIGKASIGHEPFTISVGTQDTAWYVSFPPEEGRYEVALCVNRGNEEITLASSRSFKLPKLYDPPNRIDCAKPLLRLSGAEELRVLRNTDRRSRKRG